MPESKSYEPAQTPMKDKVRFKLTEYIAPWVQKRKKWTYITLGGQQLIDVRRVLDALDTAQYPAQIISCYYDREDDYESARENMGIAEDNANAIQRDYGLRFDITIMNSTVKAIKSSDLKTNRVSMFLDYEGTVATYHDEVGSCVVSGILDCNSLLFVTSCADEKFLGSRTHPFRMKADERVASFLRIRPEGVDIESILKYHDFNILRDEIRKNSFSHMRKLDCTSLGPLVVYEDTTRMLWLPLKVIEFNPLFKPTSIELEFLRKS